MIDFNLASYLLEYDRETGCLYWKVARSNRVKIGDRAGYLHKPTGYIYINISGKMTRAHRIVWLLNYGEMPVDQIDHINQKRHDNRVQNLRSSNYQKNSKNRLIRSDNKSGVCGVYWNKKLSKWRARIGINGASVHLGLFDDISDAEVARKSAEKKHGFSSNHGRRLQ